MREIDDIDIIKSLKSKNIEQKETAFEELYYKYSKLIYVVINKYVKNKEDCEELTQDVFINVFNAIDRLDEHKNIKYYLIVSAKNLSQNYLNSKRFKEKEITNSLSEIDSLNYEHSYDDIYEELKKYLDDLEIDILYRKIVYEETYKEMSKSLSIPIGTLMSKYSRALKKFKRKRKEGKL